MKAVVVEIQGNQAAVLSEDGQVRRVPNHQYTEGQVIFQENSPVLWSKRVLLPTAAAAVLAITATAAYGWMAPYSYVSLDVNPSVEYTLNRFDRVLEIKGINDDGKELLTEIQLEDLRNATIDKAVADTIQKLEEKGYFDEEAAVMLTASAKSIKKTDQLVKTLAETVEEETQDHPVDCQVEAVGLERVEQARELGTTPGKLNLVEKLQESAQDPDDIDVEDWLDCSVQEIQQAIKENRKDEKEQNQQQKEENKEEKEEEKSQAEQDRQEQKEEKEQQQEEKKEAQQEKKEEQQSAQEEKKEEQAEKKEEKKQSQQEKKEEQKDNRKKEKN